MDKIHHTPSTASGQYLSCAPMDLALLFNHMSFDLQRQRFRLHLIGKSAPRFLDGTANLIDAEIPNADQPNHDHTTTEHTEEAHRRAVREGLNAQMRPILIAIAQSVGLNLDVWRARIDGPMPLTDTELLRALPEVFASDAFRDARRACRDMTLMPSKMRPFAEEPFDLGFRGRPPANILASHPCWDLPFVPGAQSLERWTIQDAAAFMIEWPPEPGELRAPMDAWDAHTADLWLRQHKLSIYREAERTDPVVAYRKGRTKRGPLKVLAGLEGDALLVLTDALLCERLRRDVMSRVMQERADLIHVGLQMVACGYLSLDDVRTALAAHDEARDGAFAEAFAENDDWMGEWIVDWSDWLIDQYNWPLRSAPRVRGV